MDRKKFCSQGTLDVQQCSAMQMVGTVCWRRGKVCSRTSSVSWRSCRMTKQTPLLNYLSDQLCELWVVNLKLEKQKLNLSRTMDVNREITISWKKTLEKPRYKRADNFWSWTRRGKLMRKEQWKKYKGLKHFELTTLPTSQIHNICLSFICLDICFTSNKPYPQCPSVMYMLGYLLYF